MAVTLGLSPDVRWSVSFSDYLAAARTAGFGTVGLAKTQVGANAGAELDARGMACHELVSLRLLDGDPVAQARELASLAAEVRAPWVLTGGLRVPPSEVVTTLQQAGAIVADAGARLAIEFSPAASIRSIREALELVEAVGGDLAGILIDTWHFFRGTSTWDDLAAVPLERIAYVQFTDALAPASTDGVDETMNRRAMPGDGVFELQRFADTLLARGWDGLVSVEVLSRDLNRLSMEDFARRAYDSTSGYWK